MNILSQMFFRQESPHQILKVIRIRTLDTDSRSGSDLPQQRSALSPSAVCTLSVLV